MTAIGSRGARRLALATALVAAVAVALIAPARDPRPAAASPPPAVTLVNAFGEVWDVYLDERLASPLGGLGVGSIAVDRGSGPVRVGVFAHVDAPPASPTDRTDGLTDMTVTIPAVDSASIVIGHAPAGGAGLPFVSVFTNDVAVPAPGTGRFVLRHTADAAPMDYEVVSMSTFHWTVLTAGTLERGAETTVEVPVPAPGGLTQLYLLAKPQGSTYALPPLLEDSVLVHDREVVVSYAHGPVVRGATTTPAACPDPGAIPPAGASDVTSVRGDLDGDGIIDEVFSWSEVVAGETQWSLGLVPGSGNGARTTLTQPDVGPVALLGAADADGGGRDEVFLRVAAPPDGVSGAGTNVQIWGAASCSFEAAVIEAGPEPATFVIDGEGTDRSGAWCSYSEFGGELNAWSVPLVPPPDGQLDWTAYRWDGLTLRTTIPFERVAITDQDAVLIAWASTLRCGVPRLALVTTTPAVPTAVTPAAPVAASPVFTG